MSEMLLSALMPGQKAEIIRVQGETEIRHRLAAMGFMKGTPVAVGYSALLGDPRSYRIRGSQVSLRKSEAEQILVRLTVPN